ncbi:MAG: family 1 glycosylhydrolase [Patescibacteria group bacterium]|nr:family 1 glycosylhydrolase [Patescibacteria group bacterium]
MRNKKKKEKLQFPAGFYWGAAGSAHQVEGGNVNDWSVWEKKNAGRLAREARSRWRPWQQRKFPEMFREANYISGQAADHYSRYEADFFLAKSLGHNAHRFCVEWSRIEPECGRFDQKELNHYKAVVKALRKRGLEPFATLWHFSLPLWVAKNKGVMNRDFPAWFSRYAQKVVKSLGVEVKFYLTINEPEVLFLNAFWRRCWPGSTARRTPWNAWKYLKQLQKAHAAVYDKLKKLNPELKISWANNLDSWQSYNKQALGDRISARFMEYFRNDYIFNLAKGKRDFVAVQNYFHNRASFPFKVRHQKEDVSDLGWGIYPPGIYLVLKRLNLDDGRGGKLPVYITENGLADSTDRKRARFIRDNLYWISRAIDEGIDVRGYFYWSLTDNFEWDKGFWPRFGLVEVDYKTQERKARGSAREYAKIIKDNS